MEGRGTLFAAEAWLTFFAFQGMENGPQSLDQVPNNIMLDAGCITLRGEDGVAVPPESAVRQRLVACELVRT